MSMSTSCRCASRISCCCNPTTSRASFCISSLSELNSISLMPVSGRVGGLALPAYTGGRRPDLEQHRDHAARPSALAPGAEWCETNRGRLHGRENPAETEVRA